MESESNVETVLRKQPQRLASFEDVLKVIEEHPETHLLIGFGSSLQFADVSAVELALKPALQGIQQRVERNAGVDKPWLLLYGGDSADPATPDVGLLAQRLAATWRCKVAAPQLQLGDTPPSPQTFLDYYLVLPAQYEDELEQQQPQQGTAAVAAEGAAAAGAGAAATAPSSAIATTATDAVISVVAAAVEASGGPEPASPQEATAPPAAEPAVTAAAAGVAGGVLGKRSREDADGPQGTCDGDEEEDGSGGGGGDCGSKEEQHVANRQRVTTARLQGAQEPQGPQDRPDGHQAGDGQSTSMAAQAGDCSVGVSNSGGGGGGGGGGDSGSGGSAAAPKRKVIWGGIRDGRPAGPNAMLLHDRLIGGGPDGGRRLLTSILVAGGGPLALQELQHAASRGVPYTYIRCRPRRETLGEFGPVDAWVREQEEEEKRKGRHQDGDNAADQ